MRFKSECAAADPGNLFLQLVEPALGDQQIHPDPFSKTTLYNMGAALFEQRLEQSEQIIVKVQPKMQHRLYGNGIKQSQSLLNRAGIRPNKNALAKLYPTEVPDNGTVKLTQT